MISHALTIVVNELNQHLKDSYGATSTQVKLGNIAEGFAHGSGLPKDMFYLSVVNIREEKTLKNIQAYTRDDTTLKATYENPPVFLNFLVLMTATHTEYNNALLVLSRVIRFFQSKNVFTQDNVDPKSLTQSAPVKALDQIESFKLIFDLYSPTLEEVNHLWGTLGGKQYPFVLYVLRMLDLKFKAVQEERPLVSGFESRFGHKTVETIG